ncbi:MAG: hypothetical protein ACLP66_22055 [Polyangia bacterium]
MEIQITASEPVAEITDNSQIPPCTLPAVAFLKKSIREQVDVRTERPLAHPSQFNRKNEVSVYTHVLSSATNVVERTSGYAERGTIIPAKSQSEWVPLGIVGGSA